MPEIFVKEEQEKSSFWITKQELTIIMAVTEGKTSKEIAEERGLSLRTVEALRYNAMKRCSCRNMSQLVLILAREKFLL